MTNEFGGVEHAFGRVEAKLDGIDGKIDRHAEIIAGHGVRLDRLEKDNDLARASDVVQHGHRVTGRQVIVASVAGALGTGVITWVINLLTHH